MRVSGSLLCTILGGALGLAQPSPVKVTGEAVYKQRCAGCHEQTDARIPPRSALRQMPAERILHVLDFGAMMTVRIVGDGPVTILLDSARLF